MATPAQHPDFYRDRYPVREDLDALIWAWENIPEIRQRFHRPANGEWGGWSVFSRAAAGQNSVDSDASNWLKLCFDQTVYDLSRGRRASTLCVSSDFDSAYSPRFTTRIAVVIAEARKTTETTLAETPQNPPMPSTPNASTPGSAKFMTLSTRLR